MRASVRHGFEDKPEHGIKRRPPALGPVTIAEPFDEPATEILKIDGRIQHFERITMFAQTFKMLTQTQTKPLPTGVGRILHVPFKILKYDVFSNGSVRG